MINEVNKQIFSKLLLTGLLLLVLPLAACNSMAGTAAAAPTDQTESSAPMVIAQEETVEVTSQAAPIEAPVESVSANDVTEASDIAAPALSEDEIADLLFMREEEKMARDLYLAFSEQWGIPVFQNIAASEQAHMDAILGLLTQYGLQDPVADNEPGVFVDETLQALYEQLLAAGSQSAADALNTGAVVEEVDILDLEGSLAQTNKSDIVAVYHQLLAGSENHLRAFVSSWERQVGEAYQPQYLNQAKYTAIMGDDTAGAGNGQGQGGNGQGGNGQGGNGQGGNGQGGNGQGGGNGKGFRGGRGGDDSIDNTPGGIGGRGAQ